MKQKLTKLLCSVFLVAFAIPAIAQSSGGSSTRTITGKVTDSEGAPIIGAVVMASQREATTTNSEGRYTLAVQSPDAVLRFSCMGYRPRSENTAGRTVVDVSLETDNQLLEDVVVVGYGVQKKVNLTGSVASIDFSKTSESRSIISTSAALAGLAAGMNVTQSSGQPGSDNATIRIRGDGSFTSGANGPLVLVDGVEWSMDNVNPNDIASISVLKDAASASIYGTRAANGVILITTKNGSSGKAQISYSYKGILQMPYNDLHFVSDYARHMELINESCDNIGTSRIFSQSNIDLWREKSADPYGVGENGVPNFALYPNTDWFDEIFENGYSQEHNLSISGGSEKIRYLLSLGYLDNQGVMGRFGIDSSTQKVNFRTNLEADVTKWFTAGVRLFGQRQEYGLANISGAFNALYQTTPGVYPGSVNAWGRPALAAEESSNANNIFGMMYGSGGYNNYNHSTITVNDALHRAGGRAEISSVINTSASKGATIDMTDILSSECESATRTVTLENDTDLVVKDIVKAKYNKAADVRWTMVTRAIPTVEGNRIVLQGASKKLYLKVTSQNNAKVTLKTWSTVGESYDASNAGYYEAGFEAKVTSGQTDTFTVTLSPNE